MQEAIPNEAITYVVELKIDEVAISLIYRTGPIHGHSAARGDGETGEDDVTAQSQDAFAKSC